MPSRYLRTDCCITVKKISLIVAMSENGMIGQNNQLLWHLPNDLKHFKALTLGKPIIMGRKTFASIGKVLPGRQNIILTHDLDFHVEGATIVHSPAQALAITQEAPEVMIVGGGEIYRLFFPLANCLYITYVHTTLQGEVSFVEFETKDWQEIARVDCHQDAQHAYDYSFVTLVRNGVL